MLISHRYKFIYLKTTKTASSSVELALEPYALPSDFRRDVAPKDGPLVTDAGIVGARGKDVTQYDWFNHMSAQLVKERIGEDIWNSYFKFCNIRNPWDKTVSAFHFLNPEIKNEKRDTIFKTFNDWLVRGDKLNHNRGTYCINRAPVVDDVIRYETLVPEMNRICGKLGLPMIKLPTLKSDSRGPEKIDFREYYNSESKMIVEDLYDVEIRHYGYLFE